MNFFEKYKSENAFLVTNGITILGNIEGGISGRIEGLIKGDVKINGKVIVSETGIIEGTLKCYELVLNGTIYGDVIAYNSIIVGIGGIVHGNVSSNSITVHPKSQVKGDIKKFQLKEKLNETMGQIKKGNNNLLDSAPNGKNNFDVIKDYQNESDPKERFW
jgi:cytoskeletal protein CcmA (bactofilin family)